MIRVLTHVYSVAGEEPIYLCAQHGAELADMIQQRQRRELGVEFIPSFDPRSSELAPMMEQVWLPSSSDALSVPSPIDYYPTPESLFSDADNDDSLIHSVLPDGLLDGGFESVSNSKSIFSSTILTTLTRLANILASTHICESESAAYKMQIPS